MRSLVLRLRGICISILTTFIPPTDTVVVYGKPDYEENSLVAAALLSSRTNKPVYLIGQSTHNMRAGLNATEAALGLDASRVRLVEKSRRLRSTWIATRASLFLYTHGIFGTPRPWGRRVHINLWHGTGPKRTTNAAFDEYHGADAMMGVARHWLNDAMRSLHMRPNARMLRGNVRQSLLRTPFAQSALVELGLDPFAPIVLWLPTYRVHKYLKTDQADGIPFSQVDNCEAVSLDSISRTADKHGVQLILKPHPDDADFASSATALTSASILSSGYLFYQLLARASGVISDYSSVWVDYLDVRSGSLGFWAPDLKDFEARRGLATPSLPQVAEHLVLHTISDLEEFFAAVASGARFRSPEVDKLMHLIDYWESDDRSTDFITQLNSVLSQKRNAILLTETQHGAAQVEDRCGT